jgi:hypothetical protein
VKTVAKQYFETLEQSRRCKPHSQRRAKLELKVFNLMLRQLQIENKNAKRR